jgi:hypothetical protein
LYSIESKSSVDYIDRNIANFFAESPPHIHDEYSKGHSIALVLQPSPVQTYEQVKRLQSIDKGWAQWIYSDDIRSKVNVIAGIPDMRSNNSQIKHLFSFSHLEVLHLNPLQHKMSPYVNMIEFFFFLAVSADSRGYRWLVYGNDHSFFIPHNLLCFLQTLDSELPIYGGNKLQRGEFKKYFLYFASGGAGAVISMVGLRMVLIAWIVLQNPIAIQLFNEVLLRMSGTDSFECSQFPFLCDLKHLQYFIRNSDLIVKPSSAVIRLNAIERDQMNTSVCKSFYSVS